MWKLHKQEVKLISLFSFFFSFDHTLDSNLLLLFKLEHYRNRKFLTNLCKNEHKTTFRRRCKELIMRTLLISSLESWNRSMNWRCVQSREKARRESKRRKRENRRDQSRLAETNWREGRKDSREARDLHLCLIYLFSSLVASSAQFFELIPVLFVRLVIISQDRRRTGRCRTGESCSPHFGCVQFAKECADIDRAILVWPVSE